MEMGLTLLAVCVLGFLALVSIRKLGALREGGPIQLCGQLPLDARRAIYLVKVGRHVLVVGAAEGGLTKLGDLDASDLPASPAKPMSAFEGWLKRGREKGTDA